MGQEWLRGPPGGLEMVRRPFQCDGRETQAIPLSRKWVGGILVCPCIRKNSFNFRRHSVRQWDFQVCSWETFSQFP